MDLIGKKIRHKAFGIGTVIEQDDADHITVEFSSKTSTFQYPLAFEKFLEAENTELQEEILKDLQEKQQVIEEERSSKIAKWAEATNKAYSSEAYAYDDKKYVPVKRVEGVALTFFVFQGGIFEG